MTTKKQLKLFIESKRDEKKHNSIKRENNEVDKKILKLVAKHGIDNLAKDVYSKVANIGKELEKINSKSEFDFKKEYWSSDLERVINNMPNEDEALQYLLSDVFSITYHPEIKKIKNKYCKERESIDSNFDTILINLAKVCKNAKEGENYLKNLGFDLSEINKEESTALIAPVDLRYIF